MDKLSTRILTECVFDKVGCTDDHLVSNPYTGKTVNIEDFKVTIKDIESENNYKIGRDVSIEKLLIKILKELDDIEEWWFNEK